FFVTVAEKKLQHLLICFDAVGKRIVAEESSLICRVVPFEIKISRAPPFRPLVSCQFRFPEELKELQRKPGMLVEQTLLNRKGMIGWDDAGLPKIIDHRLAAPIVQQLSQSRIPGDGCSPIAVYAVAEGLQLGIMTGHNAIGCVQITAVQHAVESLFLRQPVQGDTGGRMLVDPEYGPMAELLQPADIPGNLLWLDSVKF